MAIGDSFKDFMSDGIVSSVGSAGLAARVGAAALAMGLVFAVPATPAVAKEPPGVTVDLGSISEAYELVAVYANTAVRHGLDPTEFSLFVFVDHELNGIDAEKISLPPSARAVKGEVQLPTRELRRWVDMVMRHGDDSGIGDAIQAYRAATKLESGKRRQPITEEVLKRLAALREDPEIDAAVLVREAQRIKAEFASKGIKEPGVVGLYIASAFGVERAIDFAKAMEKNRDRAAHTVLKVAPSTLKDLSLSDGPASVEDLVLAIEEKIEEYREGVAKSIERTMADAGGMKLG